MEWTASSLWRFGTIGCLVVVAWGCGGEPEPPAKLDPSLLHGWRAYVALDCARCHGENREGTRTAPPLVGLAEHWTAEELVIYFEDPDAMVKSDARLNRLAGRYTVQMPPVSAKAPGYSQRDEQLRELAEYMLVDIPGPGE